MKSSKTRRPLHQQTVPEQHGPFFSHAHDDAKKKDDAFFQTKLAVNEPGDKHEQEADKVADKVMRKTEEKQKPEVQMKSKEDEKKDPAAAPVKAEEKKALEKTKGMSNEEDKKISKKDDEQADIQKMDKKEEDKPIQKMSDSDKKDEDKTKVNKKDEQGSSDGAGTVMMKEAGGTHAAHRVSLEERIKQSKGKGQTLPDDVRAFLEKQLGADLGEVVIHTDSDAIAMNKELGSLAFTNGFDIYFNAGQYKPDTAAGQKLLAHELTHVVQQTGVSKKKEEKK